MATPDRDALSDRYRGCLLGLACGDALGGPVEFVSRGTIAAAYPSGLLDFVGGGWLSLAPGEITDDTQMTLALAESLATGAYDMEDVAACFVAWYRSDPKDIGNTTRVALRSLAQGVPWSEAGRRALADAGNRAAGNGSVMRCAPVALRYRGDQAMLRRVSIDSALVTHADPRCTAGAVAINQALVHLLDGGSRDGVLTAAIAGLEDTETISAVNSAATLSRDHIRSGGFVLHTVTAALWALLHHDTLDETIVAAVALGDDADTTGAAAGALAGACYGASAIPARWLDLLQPRADLIRLADRLLSINLRAP